MNFKRIICIMLALATMATLLVGCGSSKELPPAQPASEVAVTSKAAVDSDLEKKYSEMTIEELCALSFEEMLELSKVPEVIKSLSEEDMDLFTTAFYEKQDAWNNPYGDYEVGGTLFVHSLLSKSMLWTPDDENFCDIVVDCITGYIYEIPAEIKTTEGIIAIVKEQRNALSINNDTIREEYKYEVAGGFSSTNYTDTYTGLEYGSPLDLYLARKDAGILPEILGEELYNKIDQTKTY